MPNEELKRRAEEALERLGIGLQEIANRMDMNYVTAWRISKGLRARPESLRAFALAVGERPGEWIALAYPELAEDVRSGPAEVRELGEGYRPIPDETSLRVAGTLRASQIEAPEEETGAYFHVTASHAQEADYVVLVEGGSMYPAIFPGDYVAIREGRHPEVGEIVVARQGDTRFLKRYQGRRGKRIMLTSDNPEYGPLEGEDIEIIGVFAWMHRPRKIAKDGHG